MRTNKIIWVLIIIVAIILIFKREVLVCKKQKKSIVSSCPIKTEERIVRGNSLSPLIKSGQHIKALIGYYRCYPVKRNDIVLYHYTDDKNPLIKIVRAVPGDEWKLQKGNSGYNIIVNNRLLTNSEGELYQVIGNRVKILQIYINDYPIIPQNTYLLLGDKINGSLDSTRFGLVDISSIIGKAILQN
jgi:signal peptidase I